VGTFVWSVLLLAQLFGRGWTTLLWAMTVQIFSPMLVSYWWYSPITAVSGAVYALAAMYWLHRPEKKSAMVSYGAALLLIATMKANVPGITIPGFSLILFLSPKHRWKTLWLSLGAFALFLVLLSLNHFSFAGMLDAYRSIAPRGASLVPFLIDLSPVERRLALVMLVSILLPAVLALSQGNRTLRSPASWIPTVALLGGLLVFRLHGRQ